MVFIDPAFLLMNAPSLIGIIGRFSKKIASIWGLLRSLEPEFAPDGANYWVLYRRGGGLGFVCSFLVSIFIFISSEILHKMRIKIHSPQIQARLLIMLLPFSGSKNNQLVFQLPVFHQCMKITCQPPPAEPSILDQDSIQMLGHQECRTGGCPVGLSTSLFLHIQGGVKKS